MKENEYKQVCYHYETAIRECNECGNALDVMQRLGFKIIASVPQSMTDCIWFTVEDYIDDMPYYINKMQYNFDYWHNKCWKECEYFQKDSSCCYGGEYCLKDETAKARMNEVFEEMKKHIKWGETNPKFIKEE